MKILIAEDESISRRVLEATLKKWGFDLIVACDGGEAWEVLKEGNTPLLAILDIRMPGMSGIEICREVRKNPSEIAPYLILLTSNGGKANLVAGLEAGANDYLTKPFDEHELRARIGVGKGVLDLQQKLANRVHELENAMREVKQLRGMLPICCYCKRVRDDQNYWQQVEGYIQQRSDLEFTHSICPSCFQSEVKPELTKMRQKLGNTPDQQTEERLPNVSTQPDV